MDTTRLLHRKGKFMIIENPTKEQLKTIKGIIYLIRNKINNKCYIGQSINTFFIRYKGGKWYKSSNILVYNAYKKYKKDNFQISLLENEITDQNKLNILEKKYAVQYNSYAPNGYNLLECGQSGGKRTKEFIDIYLAKTYKLKSPEGKIFKFKNLSEFCKKYCLDRCHMYKVANGTRKQHKGWTTPEQEHPYVLLEHKHTKEQFKIQLYYGNLTKFCKKKNLVFDNICAIIYGNSKTSGDWILKEKKLKSVVSFTDKIEF